MSDDRHAKILEVLSEVSHKPAAEIQPTHSLAEDLDLSSAESLELLSTLEEEFDLDIAEVDAAKLLTVADVLRYVDQHTS